MYVIIYSSKNVIFSGVVRVAFGHVQLIVVTFGDFQVTPVIHLVCLVALLDRLKIVPQISRVN